MEPVDQSLRRWTHKTIHKVSQDIERFGFNTVISSLMEFTNAIYEAHRQPVNDLAFQEAKDTLLLLLAPIAPFMAEEIWALQGRKYSIHQQEWPAYDASLAADEVITLVLQVNGKVRGRISMPVGLTEADARNAALENESVLKHLQGHTPRKVIYVAGKLVNIVV